MVSEMADGHILDDVDPIFLNEIYENGAEGSEDWADQFIASFNDTSPTHCTQDGQDGQVSSTQLATNLFESGVAVSTSISNTLPSSHVIVVGSPRKAEPAAPNHDSSSGNHATLVGAQDLLVASLGGTLPQISMAASQPLGSAALNAAMGHQTAVNRGSVLAPNRTRTPNPSPVPSVSPSISSALTPGKAMLTTQQQAGLAPGLGSVNMLHLPSGTVPVHTLLSGHSHLPASSPATLIGNPIMQPHPNSNIVNTQNAVIQNPNVVNVNVAHVLCNNQQNGQSAACLQSVPVSVGATGAQVPAALIQTPQGPRFLITNGGQQLNLSTMHQLQQMGVFPPPQLNLGSQINSASCGTSQQPGGMIRFAPAPAAATFGADSKSTSSTTSTATFANQLMLNLGPSVSPVIIQRQPNIIFRSIAPTPSVVVQPSMQATVSSSSSGGMQTTTSTAQNMQQLQFLSPQQLQQLKLLTQNSQPLTFSVPSSSVPLQQTFFQVQGLPITLQNGKQTLAGQTMQDATHQAVTLMPQSTRTTPTAMPATAPPKAATPTNILDEALKSSGIMDNGEVKTTSKSSKQRKRNAQARAAATAKPAVSVQMTTLPSAISSGLAGQQMGQKLSSAGVSLPVVVGDQLAGGLKVGGGGCQSSPVGVVRPNNVLTTTLSAAPSGHQKLITMIASSNPSLQVTDQLLQTAGIPAQTMFDNQSASGVQAASLRLQVSNPPSITTTTSSSTNTSTSVLQSCPVVSVQCQQANPVLISSHAVVEQPKVTFAQSSDGRIPLSLQQQLTEARGQSMQVRHNDKLKPFLQLGQTHGVNAFTAASSNHSVVPSQAGFQSISKLSLSGLQGSASGSVPQLPGRSTSHVPVVVKMATSSESKPDGLLPLAGQSGQKLVLSGGQHAGKLPLPSLSSTTATQIKISDGVVTFNLNAPHQNRLMVPVAHMAAETQDGGRGQQRDLQCQLPTALQQQSAQSGASLGLPKVQTQTQIIITPSSKTVPLPVQQLDRNSCSSKPTSDSASSSSTTITITTTSSSSHQPPLTSGSKKPPEIPKAMLLHTQLSKDQMHAVCPDTRTPFKNNREACRRLLRLHCFQSPGPSEKAFQTFDKLFTGVSEDLIAKQKAMLGKFQTLLLSESRRKSPSAEQVMMQRILVQDITQKLKEEKAVVKEDPTRFVPMPAKYLKRKYSYKKVVEKMWNDNYSSSEEDEPESQPKQSDPEQSPSQSMKLVIRHGAQGFSIAPPPQNHSSSPSEELEEAGEVPFVLRQAIKKEPFSDDSVIPSDCGSEGPVECKQFTVKQEQSEEASGAKKLPAKHLPSRKRSLFNAVHSSLSSSSRVPEESEQCVLPKLEPCVMPKKRKHVGHYSPSPNVVKGADPSDARLPSLYEDMGVDIPDTVDDLGTARTRACSFDPVMELEGDVHDEEAGHSRLRHPASLGVASTSCVPSSVPGLDQQDGAQLTDECASNLPSGSSHFGPELSHSPDNLQLMSSFSGMSEYGLDEAPSLTSETSSYPQTHSDPFGLSEVNASEAAATLEHAQSGLGVDFDPDTADPQGEMMNAQVQSAIDSILQLNNPPSYVSDTSETFDSSNSNLLADFSASAVPKTQCFDETAIDDDLEEAVRSIMTS